MSKATLIACRDCGKPSKSGVCERCQRRKPTPLGWATHGSGSNVQRGYGVEWYKARERRKQAHPVCEYCERLPSTQVDHHTPKHKGGTDDYDNLRACCEWCHKRKTARERAEVLRKVPQPIGTYQR